MRKIIPILAIAGLLAAGSFGMTSGQAQTGTDPLDPTVAPPAPPPIGTPLPVLDAQGVPIVCPDGTPLMEATGAPPTAVPVTDYIEDLETGVTAAEEIQAQPLEAASCTGDNKAVWRTTTDTSAQVSTGISGTCDITATLRHDLIEDGFAFQNDTFSFTMDATGTCTGWYDDRRLQSTPVNFTLADEYECGSVVKGSGTGANGWLDTVLNLDPAALGATTDPTVDVTIRNAGTTMSDVTALVGAAMMNGTIGGEPRRCYNSTGTYTGQLQTLVPLRDH